jgi:hypothetical protein
MRNGEAALPVPRKNFVGPMYMIVSRAEEVQQGERIRSEDDEVTYDWIRVEFPEE